MTFDYLQNVKMSKETRSFSKQQLFCQRFC